MKKIWVVPIVFLLFWGCYSNKNKTEERARERVTQFVLLMATDQIEEAEKLLSRQAIDSENTELFLSKFDDWRLKDTTDLIININPIRIPDEEPKNKTSVSMVIRNEKHDFTKMTSMPLTYEKGDWYIGP